MQHPFLICAVLVGSAFLHKEARALVPPDLCNTLPPVSSEMRNWITVRHIPMRDNALVVEVPFSLADAIITKAADTDMTTTELFSEDAWRNECYVYISAEVLEVVNRKFDLHLMVPVAGEDVSGRSFRIEAILSGFGEHIIITNRAEPLVYYDTQNHIKLRIAAPIVTRITERNSIALEDVEILGYPFDVKIERTELRQEEFRARIKIGILPSFWHSVLRQPITFR